MESSTPRWRRQEARATIALAYPLILTNLAQALIQTTDVVLLGWAGPDKLAAGALGVNLFNACMVFGVGLVTASAPMMARALGQRSHNVRDVRRTVRQAMWAAVAVSLPMWALLWHAEAILLAFHQEAGLAHDAGRAGAADDVRHVAADALFRAALLRLGARAAGLGIPGRRAGGLLQTPASTMA